MFTSVTRRFSARFFPSFFVLCLVPSVVLAAAQDQSTTLTVAAASEQLKLTGSTVAATPISIPRPIRLQVYDPRIKRSDAPIPIPKPAKDTDTALPPAGPGAGGRGLDPGLGPMLPTPKAKSASPKFYGTGPPSSGVAVGDMREMQDNITACELLRRRNDELYVRIYYKVDSARKRPLYAGAWLFGPDGKDVGAGYKPVVLPPANAGTVDVVLSLPQGVFESAYIEPMIVQSGTIVTKGRFAAAYLWNAVVTGSAAPMQVGLTNVSQLQGAWTATLFGKNVEYVFTADGDHMSQPARFQWRCDAFQQVAKGSIRPGNQLQASWSENGAPASGTAVVDLDSSGQAIRMSWSNGVVMIRNPN